MQKLTEMLQFHMELILGKGFEFKSYVPATGKNPTDLSFDDTFTTDVFSIFGQYSIDLSDATELSLEGRYDKEKRSVDNNVPAQIVSFILWWRRSNQPCNDSRWQ